MENKKININQTKLANSIIGINTSTKITSSGITLDPLMAKIFIGGMLKSKGINNKEINNTLNILDSQIKNLDTKLEQTINNKKETINYIKRETIIEKGKDDISIENNKANQCLEINESSESLESTK